MPCTKSALLTSVVIVDAIALDTAKCDTYTLLDENIAKIPAFCAVQVTEATSPNAMEAEGCKKGTGQCAGKQHASVVFDHRQASTITSEMRKKYISKG